MTEIEFENQFGRSTTAPSSLGPLQQLSQATSSLPGHSSSYVFTQWGAGKEAKVFTYNLTDDHVDKLKFGPAKDSELTFDFTGLFEKQESPRQSIPKQKPIKTESKRPKN